MSGDVQPRKRKDKKKRKDEGDGYGVLSNEDLTIHVQKDGGTGGNICSKIVFFFLFSALIVLIGLIIRENQGLNELETIEAESRFSQIFEGWIDKTPDNHEDHSPEIDDHYQDDDHREEEDEEKHFESEESDIEEDTEEDQSQELNDDDEQEIEDEDSTPRSEEEELTEETEEELPQSEEDEEDETNTEEEETKEQSDEKHEDYSEEIKDTAEDDSDDQENLESKENDEIKEDYVESREGKASVKTEDELITKAASAEFSKSETKEIKEEPKERDLLEKQDDTVALPEAEPEPARESSGLATKIGVGLALLTVAYNVFLRKRRSEIFERQTAPKPIEAKEITPDLSRRNTIVPPPSLQEVEQDLPDIEIDNEEYSEEEYSDEDSRSEHRSAREEYQDLRTTYTRSLTPEGDFNAKDKSFEDDVLEDEIEEEEIEGEEELEEDEIDDEYDKYDEDEDEELLKRLEAKYGKLGREVNVGEEPESDSDRDDYEYSNISNKDDYTIKGDIDAAQQQLPKNAAYANKMFEALLENYPFSPRSLYGKARALDILAEDRQSNELLKQALSYYSMALNAPDVPDQLFVIVAERYIDRARFMGQYKKAFAAHWQLIERFPDNVTYLNNLAVTYLTINLVEEARSTLKRVLSKWPDDGFALAHYGFILKTADNNLEGSIEYMTKGLRTKAPGVIDGRFYFHLGDALARLNRNDEATKLYEEGVKQKVFRSVYQRSLYNVERLTAKPWWDPKDIPSYQKLFSVLKENWLQIKLEGLSALNDQGYFQDEAENLKDTGTWKQLELFARGQKFSKNCARTPVTCGIVQKFSDASSCRRGQSKFSVMHPGTHVWPHCGPTNCRLRIHLGLKVPANTFIRVAEETRSWKEGDIIIFDDSFEHEVWHNGSDFRLVLIVDVWHPNLTPTEKKSLSSI